MKIRETREDEKIIKSASEFFHKKVKQVKFKKGFSNKDVDSNHKTSRVYNRVLFKLLELMIADVIDGDTVYFNKKTRARFYVDYRKVLLKNIQSADKLARPDIPRVDFSVTKMRTPFIAYDSGHKMSTPCLVNIPVYLYVDLIHKVNEGRKYGKSTKDFWFNVPNYTSKNKIIKDGS